MICVEENVAKYPGNVVRKALRAAPNYSCMVDGTVASNLPPAAG